MRHARNRTDHASVYRGEWRLKDPIVPEHPLLAPEISLHLAPFAFHFSAELTPVALDLDAGITALPEGITQSSAAFPGCLPHLIPILTSPVPVADGSR
jgi:hypothetical protein